MGVWRGRERVPSAGAGRAARSPSLPFLASRLAPDRSRAFAPVPLVAPRAREPPPSAAPDGDHRARRRAAARPAQGRVHRGRGRVSGGCVRWREGPRGADGGVRPSTSPPPRPRPPCAGRTADDAIRALNAAHAAYRRVEASLTAARARLLAKAPDIDKALAAVRLLQERRDAGDEVGWGGRGGVGLEPFPWTARADAHLFGPPRPPPLSRSTSTLASPTRSSRRRPSRPRTRACACGSARACRSSTRSTRRRPSSRPTRPTRPPTWRRMRGTWPLSRTA